MGYTTILHEFGHTLALGHAHTADGDLMCGIENGHKTCLSLPTYGTTPSVLDVL
jgi:hypothetical protein